VDLIQDGAIEMLFDFNWRVLRLLLRLNFKDKINQ